MTSQPLSPQRIAEIRQLVQDEHIVSKVSLALAPLFKQVPAEQRLEVLAHAVGTHPFYLPNLSDADRAALRISESDLASLTYRARQTAVDTPGTRLLVACPPKTGSSFVSEVLSASLGVRQVSLAATTYSPRTSSMLGANLREQEVDELALLKRCIEDGGFVAQHHVRLTHFLIQQMRTYRITPVVTTRNIFDAFISFDDMYCKTRSEIDSPNHFHNDAMPADFLQLNQERRLELLLDRWLYWYVQFLASWKKAEKDGYLKPVWISYEECVAPGGDALADTLVARLPALDRDQVLMAADGLAGSSRVRHNKGVAGRGAAFPQHLRDRVMRVIDAFSSEVDLSAFLAAPASEAAAA
jgi:hypothetical protein